jgi:hypothetical protein
MLLTIQDPNLYSIGSRLQAVVLTIDIRSVRERGGQSVTDFEHQRLSETSLLRDPIGSAMWFHPTWRPLYSPMKH